MTLKNINFVLFSMSHSLKYLVHRTSFFSRWRARDAYLKGALIPNLKTKNTYKTGIF